MNQAFLLIPFLNIFFVNVSFTQTKQDEYNKLVEYVNCKYAIDYIDLNKSEIKNFNYKNDFEKYKKAFNDNVKSYPDIYIGFNKKFQNSTSVYHALKQSAKGFRKAEVLWQFIENKKKGFSSDWTKEQMIDYLILLSDKMKVTGQEVNFKTILNITTNQIKKDLKKQISENLFDANQEIVNETSATKITEIKSEKTKLKTELESKTNEKDLPTNQEQGKRAPKTPDTNKGKSKFPSVMIIIFSALTVVGYFGYIKRESIKNLLNRRKSKYTNLRISDLIDYQKRCTELELENIQLRDFEQENAQLRTINKKLQQRIRELEGQKLPKAEPEKKQPTTNCIPVAKEEKQLSIKATFLYADAIINDEFHRTNEQPNADTVFELELTPNVRTASFHIYIKAYPRVIKNPDFLDGCEKLKISPKPQYLEVEKGVAAQDDFGKWKVTKKAIIKFL